MLPQTRFSPDVLNIDAEAEVARIVDKLRTDVRETLHKRGAVLGLSGGVDSSVVAALCARAFGPERVLGILMPEQESSGDSLTLGRLVGETFGIPTLVEDVTAILGAAGCYWRRDEAIRAVVPEYAPGYKSKLVLPNVVDGAYRIFSVVVQSPTGEQIRARLTPEAYRAVVAATNFKQRVRKMVEYHHADRNDFAVAGTPNRLEYDQGFFVKNGDGSADVKPIAHLYKTQVYALARYLGVPDEICSRPPTTDTYPMEQSQEEFYFSLPYQKMDLCLYGRNHGVPAEALGPAVGLTAEQVERVYRDIDAKRRTTRPNHLSPLLVEDVPEIVH